MLLNLMKLLYEIRDVDLRAEIGILKKQVFIW